MPCRLNEPICWLYGVVLIVLFFLVLTEELWPVWLNDTASGSDQLGDRVSGDWELRVLEDQGCISDQKLLLLRRSNV